MLKKTLFNKVIYKGTLTSIYGIVTGLILGILIYGLLQVSMYTHNFITGARYYNGPPFEFFIIMGMSFGAVIGSIFGSITALKEK